MAMIFLHDGHDEFEMNIRTELEHGFGGVNDGRGQGVGAAEWTSRLRACQEPGRWLRLGSVVVGLRM
jgi:hypothetical protein